MNPIDPNFIGQSQGDPAVFAKAIDVFVQHGSRPAGDNPQLSMVGWGDHKLLSQTDLADIEAYVMQLNGVYWPDRWAPPAEVRMSGQLDVDRHEILYTITLVNHSAGVLTGLDLVDTLPSGLAYAGSSFPTAGQNPGKVVGSSVKWNNQGGVPRGGTLGPFTILVNIQQGATAPANVAQLMFTWTSWDGSLHTSTVVSEPVLPKSPKPAVKSPVTATTPVAASPTAMTSTTSVPSTAVATLTVSAGSTVVPTSPNGQATETPTPQPPTPTQQPPTTTPLPAAPAPANFGVEVVQPGPAALSWGYAPPSITIHVGDSMSWSNSGSLQHTVTADDGSFDSGLFSTGESWSTTFKTAGTFSYHCAPHPWMKGTVVVQSVQ